MAEETTTPEPTLITRKPGIKTSEFWLTSIALAIGSLVGAHVIGGTSPIGQAVVFSSAALAVAVYSHGRTLAKR